MRRLSLDHITVTDADPVRLVELAAANGCAGVCPFLHSMAVLPAMPEYDLIADTALRRRMRAALTAEGVAVDLVYPFTLSGRSVVADFAPALAASAELGAPIANVLCYDRDPVRRIDRLGELGELARAQGMGLAIEFYPPSQVGSLAAAFEAIGTLGRDDVGVTLDLLHLVRSGEMPDALPLLADPRIRIAQLSDGPATMAADRIEWEAGIQRLLPGKGAFDIAAFLAATSPDVPLSIEVPRQDAIDAGLTIDERVRMAVAAARRFMDDGRQPSREGRAA